MKSSPNSKARVRSRSIRAGVHYFALVFGVGFLLGPIRMLWLEPLVGAPAAELIETPLMAWVIIRASRWVVRRNLLPPTAYSRLLVGLPALAMMVACEIGVGMMVRGYTFTGCFTTRNPVSGTVYLVMLLGFGLQPYLSTLRERAKPE